MQAGHCFPVSWRQHLHLSPKHMMRHGLVVPGCSWLFPLLFFIIATFITQSDDHNVFLSVLLLISSPLDDTQPQQKVNSFARHCATGIAMFFSSLLLFFLYLLCSVLKYQGNNVLIYTTPSCEKSTNQTFALHLSLLH